jgi:hypothetical protein
LEVVTRKKQEIEKWNKQVAKQKWAKYMLGLRQEVEEAERLVAKDTRLLIKLEARAAAKQAAKQAAKWAAKLQDSQDQLPDTPLNIEETGCKCVRVDLFTG